VDHGERPIRLALDALADAGDGSRISAAWGASVLGEETLGPVEAMSLADQRMYEGKRSGRVPAEHQVRDAVLAVLEERGLDLGDDHGAASDVARAVVERIEADSGRLGPRVAPRH